MMKKIIAIVLAVIAIAMIGFGIYTMNSSKYIFKTAVSGVFKYATDAYDDFTDSINKFSENKKGKLTTNNYVSTSGIEIAKVTGEYYYDFTSGEKMYFNLDSSTFTEENFFGIESVFENETSYFKIKEAMDEFYYVNLEDEFDFEELSSLEEYKLEDKEFNLLMKHFKQSIFDSVSDKDLSKKSEIIKIDNEEYKTSKISLNVSEKTTLDIAKNTLKKIIKDENAIKVLQKFSSEITKKSLQELLDMLNEVKDADLSKDTILTLSFYVEGFGGLRRIEIASPKTEYDDQVKIMFDIYNNNNSYLFTIKQADETILLAKREYTSKTNSNILVKIGTGEINGTIKETTTNTTAEINFIEDSNEILSLTYTNTEIKKDKEYKISLSCTISGTEENTSVIFTSDNEIKFGESIPSVSLEGAKDINEVSDSELEEIGDYLTDKFGFLNTFNPFEDDYDDDYDDDSYWDEEEAYDTFWYDEITVDEIEDLMDSNTPVILWMGSQYCSHCADYAEVLDDSYFDYDYDIYYIDVDTLTEEDVEVLKSIDARLGSITTPTTLVLQNKKVKEIKRGAMSKTEYYSFLHSYGIE